MQDLDNKRAMVVLSGGMDSAALLYHMQDTGYEVQAVSIHYGQRHDREVTCARKVCLDIGCDHKYISIPNIGDFLRGSSQTDMKVDVPHGHYEEESMKLTVVPNRNMILLAVAGGFAISEGCGVLAYGAHSGDHAIYPDCRPEFVDAMQQAFMLCHFDALHLLSPFQHMHKGEIAGLGMRLGTPFSLTHTCYEGQEIACGKCGACQERIEAFKFAKAIDPVEYGIAIDWTGCEAYVY